MGVRSHLQGDTRQANTRVLPTRGGPKANTKSPMGGGEGSKPEPNAKTRNAAQPCNGRNLRKRMKQQTDSINRLAVRPPDGFIDISAIVLQIYSFLE